MQQLHSLKSFFPHLRHWKDLPVALPAALARVRAALLNSSLRLKSTPTPQPTTQPTKYEHEIEDLPRAYGEDGQLHIDTTGSPVYYYDHDYLTHSDKETKEDRPTPPITTKKKKASPASNIYESHQEPNASPPPPARDERLEKRLFLLGLYRSMLRLAFVSYPGNPEAQVYAWNKVRSDFRKHAVVVDDQRIGTLLAEAQKYVELMNISIFQSKLKARKQTATSFLAHLQQAQQLQQRLQYHQAPYSTSSPTNNTSTYSPNPSIQYTPTPQAISQAPHNPVRPTTPSSNNTSYSQTAPSKPQNSTTSQTVTSTQAFSSPTVTPSPNVASSPTNIPSPLPSPLPSPPTPTQFNVPPPSNATPSSSKPLSLAQLPPFSGPTMAPQQKQQQGLVVDRFSPNELNKRQNENNNNSKKQENDRVTPPVTPLQSSHTYSGAEVFQYSLKNKANVMPSPKQGQNDSGTKPTPSSSPPSPIPPSSTTPPSSVSYSRPPASSPSNNNPFVPEASKSSNSLNSSKPQPYTMASTAQSPSEARNEFWRNYSELTKKC